MNINEKTVAKAIKEVAEQDDATLVYWWQCLSSGVSTKAEKDLVRPLIDKIDKERKKRGSASTYKKSDHIIYE